MNSFSLHLLAADRSEHINGVSSFVAADSSGSFGLLAGHERFMTVLDFGLARVRIADGSWEYLGLPGGLLYFIGNECRISTRRYVRNIDITLIASALAHELLEEEQALSETRYKLHQMEAEMLKQLARLARE